MHLSLMGTDELPALNKKKEEEANDQTMIHKSEKEEKPNQFETSHELCKDAMLEKIVLISVAYFCIATEMRFIM